ncbi:MAG: penicillin-binding protein 2 [Alphaproteobacteria bacterium]|nr:penicillin-binding protein 2 [Alphaproteobacteria bacterium]
MYADEFTQESVFSRRAVMLLGAQGLLTAGLVGRLYYLQILERDRYQLLADQNRLNVHLIPPTRGRIFDRNGEPIAVNRQSYRALIIPEQSKYIVATLEKLAQHVTLPDDVLDRIAEQRRRTRQSFVPIEVVSNLSWIEVSRIEVNALNLPGVIIDAGQRRIYPAKESTAHVIGYVGGVDSTQIKQNKLFALPGFKVGKSGVEEQLDDVLRGSGGTSRVEVNSAGRIIKEVNRRPAEPGVNVWSSLDNNLSHFIYEKLKRHRRASAVVMNVHSGEVLAMVSVPSYDPNQFASGIDEATWKKLTTDPDHPLTNKAITGQYPPGSTFKIAVLAAALEEGISPKTEIVCRGAINYSDRRYHCWKRGGHGRIDATGAIRESCDVWFYRIGEQLGINKIAEYAKRFGLGTKPDIPLPNVKPGLIPTKDWKRANYDEIWYNGETLISAIGQGYCLATPLQLAMMTARIASDGMAIKPSLFRSNKTTVPSSPLFQPFFPSLGLSTAALRVIQQGMWEVVNTPKGTAFGAQSWHEEWKFAGKTGTSQVRSISEEERREGVLSNKDIAWARRDHAVFVGYAPYHDPQYAVSVLIEHSAEGSGGAARFARDVFDYIRTDVHPQILKSTGETAAAPPAEDGAPTMAFLATSSVS